MKPVLSVAAPNVRFDFYAVGLTEGYVEVPELDQRISLPVRRFAATSSKIAHLLLSNPTWGAPDYLVALHNILRT